MLLSYLLSPCSYNIGNYLSAQNNYQKGGFTMQSKKKLAYIALSGVLLLSGVALLITVQAQAPQQAQIAFCSYRDGNSEIYIMDADGNNPRNLTNHPAEDNEPDWFAPAVVIFVSPAGKQPAVWGDIKQK